jgi:hypothetical protein
MERRPTGAEIGQNPPDSVGQLSMAGSRVVRTIFRVAEWMCAKTLGAELENGFTSVH